MFKESWKTLLKIHQHTVHWGRYIEALPLEVSLTLRAKGQHDLRLLT